jgi:hypothetical protein
MREALQNVKSEFLMENIDQEIEDIKTRLLKRVVNDKIDSKIITKEWISLYEKYAEYINKTIAKKLLDFDEWLNKYS